MAEPDTPEATTPPPRPDDVPLMIAVTIDCNDLEAQTAFWSEMLQVEATTMEPFSFLAPAEGRRVSIWLQRVPEGKATKNRVHLDFVVADLDAAERRVVALGGSLGERQTWETYLWRICRDPEGNEFDIMQGRQQT
jgi:predicted enzyme related to lactoylglutathione lyase